MGTMHPHGAHLISSGPACLHACFTPRRTGQHLLYHRSGFSPQLTPLLHHPLLCKCPKVAAIPSPSHSLTHQMAYVARSHT